MKEVTIRIPEHKLATFLAFVQDLEYVEILKSETSAESDDALNTSDDFFDLAGMWEGKDINAEDLRQKAWPIRK